MKLTWLVAKREMRERARERSFVIGFLVTLAIVLGLAIVPGLVDGGPDEITVGAVGLDARNAVTLSASSAGPDTRVTVRDLTGRDAAERAVREGEVDAALVGDSILVDDEPDQVAVDVVQRASALARTIEALVRAGIPGGDARSALDQRPLVVVTLDPAADERSSREALALLGTIFLFLSILGFAITVAFGVVEEKSTRVVEVLLAAIRPRQLLGGKVIGLGILGLAQLVLVAVPGLVIARAVGTLELPATDSPALVVALAVWFLLGYGIYAAVFAAAAALVSRQEDLQAIITPISLLMQGSFIVALVAADDPDGSLARVTTFLPPTAPMVVPVRFARDALPAAEHLLAMALAAGATVLLVVLAGRIYERAVLRIGARVPWREAFRRV